MVYSGDAGVRSAAAVGWDGKHIQGSWQHGRYPTSMALLGKCDPSKHGEVLEVKDESI